MFEVLVLVNVCESLRNYESHFESIDENRASVRESVEKKLTENIVISWMNCEAICSSWHLWNYQISMFCKSHKQISMSINSVSSHFDKDEGERARVSYVISYFLFFPSRSPVPLSCFFPNFFTCFEFGIHAWTLRIIFSGSIFKHLHLLFGKQMAGNGHPPLFPQRNSISSTHSFLGSKRKKDDLSSSA